jgi:hypothetical protein
MRMGYNLEYYVTRKSTDYSSSLVLEVRRDKVTYCGLNITTEEEDRKCVLNFWQGNLFESYNLAERELSWELMRRRVTLKQTKNISGWEMD